MKILVTGGAGFIGSHVAEGYRQDGHAVTVLDDLSAGRRGNIPAGCRLVAADIRDPNVATLFQKERFDVVNHHAAQIDVRRSLQDPFLDASINILGTLRLLECARCYGVQKFIFASSGGTFYGECDRAPGREEDTANPSSPYGLSKATGEAYVRFYGSQFHLSCTILRYGNVYGPRQDPHGEAGVVAIFSERMLSGQETFIYGDGKQRRDFVFVGDVVEANRQVLSKGHNETLNIASGKTTDVNTLFDLMARELKYPRPAVHKPPRPGELLHSALDIEKAARQLSWRPRVSLEQGLQHTCEYFRSRRVEQSC